LDFLAIDGIVDEMKNRVKPLQSEEVEDEGFELVYIGPDLETGTMSARELTEVFTGITKGFSVIAHERDLGDQYELRVRDIEHQSFHLVFEAVAFAKANPVVAGVTVAGATLGWSAVKDTVSGIYRVVTDLAKAIDAKLTAKGESIGRLPAKFSDSGVIVEGPDGPIELTKEQYELLLSRRMDKPLAQIVSPLAQNRVNKFELRRAKTPIASVELSQRDYFDYQEVNESETREGTEIVGTLNSFNKTNLRGTFHTVEGMHVPYRYSGGDVNKLLRGFAAKESILARGKVVYGGDGTPIRVDIQDLDFVQRPLPLKTTARSVSQKSVAAKKQANRLQARN
jgi:hypothetical protein